MCSSANTVRVTFTVRSCTNRVSIRILKSSILDSGEGGREGGPINKSELIDRRLISNDGERDVASWIIQPRDHFASLRLSAAIRRY